MTADALGSVVADTRSDLKHAAIESRFVVQHTGATPRLGVNATVSALWAAADRPPLHVIAHSGVGMRGGYSALAYGQVTAADILAWRVGPRLVVLPTCASAATIRTEMWGSLAAAFLAAGSQHVVATLTSVQDRVAADFTRQFYRANGLRDPVGGVTRALREMSRRYPVADWSPFVVAVLSRLPVGRPNPNTEVPMNRLSWPWKAIDRCRLARPSASRGAPPRQLPGRPTRSGSRRRSLGAELMDADEPRKPARR